MQAVIDRLKSLGYLKIQGSAVYKWNIPSRKMHEKLGFLPVGEDGEDIIYSLDLTLGTRKSKEPLSTETMVRMGLLNICAAGTLASILE